MNLFTFSPGKDNFILCLCVKNAEAADRKTEADEIYTGYLDGSIVLNKVTGDSIVITQEIWKGKYFKKLI